MEVKNTVSVSNISVSNQGVALYPFLESNVIVTGTSVKSIRVSYRKDQSTKGV